MHKRAAAAEAAAPSWWLQELPLPRNAAMQQDTSEFAFPSFGPPNSSLHETSAQALAEVVLNSRFSSETLDYIRQIIIDPAIVYPCCLISINSSLGELARDSVPPPSASSGFVRNKMIYVYSSKILACWQSAGVVWGWKY